MPDTMIIDWPQYRWRASMNALLLKQISVISVIAGAILGIVTIIPFVGNFTFLFTMSLLGAALVVYLKKVALVSYVEPKDAALFGAMAGFVSFIGFCVTFLPIATLIGVFAKSTYYMGISLLMRSGVFVWLMMIIFIAALSALMNAFSAMVAAYIYAQIEPKPDENTSNIEIIEE